MEFIFKTPCVYDGDGFGCASFGFSGAPDPAKEGIRKFANVPAGQYFTGTLRSLIFSN